MRRRQPAPDRAEGAPALRAAWVAGAGVAVVALLVALQGAVQRGPARLRGGSGSPEQVVTPPPQTFTPGPTPTMDHATGASTAGAWFARVLLTLLVVAVLVVVVFALRRLRSSARGADDVVEIDRTEHAVALGADEVDAAAELPALREGFDRAAQALRDEREPRDAVVQAWLGLEEAARDAGVSRRPSETATELTTRLLARVSSDEQAARTLRDLYLRVRFGGYEPGPADVATAREALAALVAAWTGPQRPAGARR